VTAHLQRKQVRHRCVRCNKIYPHSYTTFCDCGGIIEVEYDLDRAVLHDSPNSLERFFDLLPIEDPGGLISQAIAPTPCVHAQELGVLLGLSRLYLKDETVLPTATTKDRMAAVSLAFLWECGVRAFCTSSTGNSSTAYAYALAQYPDYRMYLFTAENFINRVQHADGEQVVSFGLRGASFVEAFQCAAEFAKRQGLMSERGFFNPGRREGLKLAFLEATEQVPEPIDWYVQAVSSAMGVYGTYKGARELFHMGRIRQLPRLLCVQQESCAPMVRAFEAGSEAIRPQDIVHKPAGIAEAILRGDPTRVYPYVREIVVESNGMFVAVCEQEIREARSMVEETEGISPCFSASTALAGVAKLVRRKALPTGDTILVNLTGGNRPRSSAPSRVRWLRDNGNGWEPEDGTSR
jgi:threonine synthase